MMIKHKTLLILIITVIFTSCKSYKEITRKPERLSSEIELPEYESNFRVGLKADLSILQDELNNVIKKGHNPSGEGIFQHKSWIKTKDPLYNPTKLIKIKNPLYNPKKWIKTKNPAYNPKKWIKVGFIKTKNPLYDPKKWIKTKNTTYNPKKWVWTNNPLYHPNEWIETKGPAVAVGYQYNADLKLKDKISLSHVDENTLKINVPISFKGNVGLKGNIPAGLALDKKNFDGEIDFFIFMSFSVTENWCPKIDLTVTHSWLSNPQIEIIDDIYISLTGLTDKFLNKIEKDVNKTINQQINCELIRNKIKNHWKHYNIELPTLANGKQYQLNINPSRASLSDLKVSKDTLALYIGAKGNLSLNDKVIQTTNALPPLEEQEVTPSEVKVFLPLLINYKDIEHVTNKYLKENNVVLKPDIVLNQKAKVKLKEMSFYPNGDEVVIGVRLKAKLPGNLFPVSGWIYLIGKPSMINNKKFELQDIDFSMTVDNKFYPIISSLFKTLITKEIKKQTTLDLTDRVKKIQNKLLEKANSLKQDKIGLSIDNIDFGVYEIILDKDDIAIIAEFSSKFNIILKKN